MSSTININCRGTKFEYDESTLQVIPFFQPIIKGSFPVRRDEDQAVILDLDPVLFKVVVKSTIRLSSLVRSLPKSRNIREVFSMMDYLQLNLDVNDWDLDIISKKLKDNYDYVDKIARHCYETVKGNVPGALDAATVLLLKVESGSINWRDIKTKTKAYNLLLYIISHPKVFGPRLREHLYKSIKEKVWPLISDKQKAALENWKPRNNRDDEESDYSREESSSGWDNYIDSDDDDFYY